jgi:hypothetical protein
VEATRLPVKDAVVEGVVDGGQDAHVGHGQAVSPSRRARMTRAGTPPTIE